MTIIQRLQQSGIRRLGSPQQGFRYEGALKPEDLERIKALKIPPAWTQVAIAPSPRAAVQAVGQDAAGRWQYLYHEVAAIRREKRKRERLVRFIAALPRMRRAVARDLSKPGLPREKVLAGVLQILGTCFLRPGSQEYAQRNGSYGLATLRRQHVSVSGDHVVFDFVGKSKKRQRRELTDRRIARLLRDLKRYPGEVFKFRSDDGSMTDVTTAHINTYIKTVMGESFSAKDFRTWAGTLLCACALARAGAANGRTKHERKRRIAEALREVAHHLGNTPAVCRSSYVFPAVLRNFERGRVIGAYIDVAELSNGDGRRLEKSERALVELLR